MAPAPTSLDFTKVKPNTDITNPYSPPTPYDPLSSLLTTARESYTHSNPASLSLHKDACSHLPGGNTRTVLHSFPFPITWASGHGKYLKSVDGETYVDFLGEFTAGIYGHSNERIKEAVVGALGNGWNFGGCGKGERELAKKIVTRFAPSGLHSVRFTNSGTEANTMALATAVSFTARRKILVFSNGYHGGTLTFSTDHPNPVNLPHDFVIAPYNSIQGTAAILASLPRDSLAAILVEAVQGSGGCIVASREFLHYLQTTARELGALFILDEVMTSRLSYHGYAASLDLQPDLLTLGKWVGGGMTFGAFGGRKDIMALYDPATGRLGHSGTFNNNVITMAAGITGLDVYNEQEVKRLNALGDKLRLGIQDVLSAAGVRATVGSRPCPVKFELENPFTGESEGDEGETGRPKMWVSGQGSMLAVHFEGESEESLRLLFWHHMFAQGINFAQRGFIALNIELGDEDVERFLGGLRGFVEKFASALV